MGAFIAPSGTPMPTATRLAYRLEADCISWDGYAYSHGPYITDGCEEHLALSDELCIVHNRSDDHPAPYDIDSHQVCGFASLEEAEAWFGGLWLQRHYEAGYFLKVYEVPAEDMHDDRRQAVFSKDRARLVDVVGSTRGERVA